MVVRSLIAAPALEDWRDWTLHVSDDLGDEGLALPFLSSVAILANAIVCAIKDIRVHCGEQPGNGMIAGSLLRW